MSVVRRCLVIANLFEGELLTELMLRYWQHPLADDADFRNDLLEKATQALQQAAQGERLIDSLSPENTNFVAAIWYAEWGAMRDSSVEDSPEVYAQREKWLEHVKRTIPSCFTDDIL